MRVLPSLALGLALSTLLACSQTDPEPASSPPTTSGFNLAGQGGDTGAGSSGDAGQPGAGGAASGGTAQASGKGGSSGQGGKSAAGAGGKSAAGQGGANAGGQGGKSTAGQGGAAQAGSGQAGSGQAGTSDAGSGQGGTGDAGSGPGGAGGSAAGQGGSSDAGAAGDGGAGGDSGAGGGAVCSLPVSPDEFYALEAGSIEQSDPIPMCTYQQKVVLVVNVASMCGYTPQYGPLEKLYKTYGDKGFVILGFPCNQFGNQESGTDQEISQFCTQSYGITFPMFHKIEVNGPDEHPIYHWLKSQPGGAGDIPWNFTKFLLSREGKLLARIPTETSPDDPAVVAQIEAALAQ